MWVLVAWGAIAVLGGIALGRAIGIADQRERGRDRLDEWLRPADEDAA